MQESWEQEVLEDHRARLEQARGSSQLEEHCPSSRSTGLPELLSPAAMSSHGLLHNDRHGDQGGCGFVTVLLSKSVTGETSMKPAEALHVLCSGLHLQTTTTVLGRNIVTSKDVSKTRGIVTLT